MTSALGMAQQQVALLGRRLVPAAAVGLVGAHFLDADAERAHAGQRLEHVEVLGPVSAVPAALIPGDRADQPDLLVIAQRRLTQPEEGSKSRSVPALRAERAWYMPILKVIAHLTEIVLL